MKIKIPEDLKKIAHEITNESLSLSYWEERESCDMFQIGDIEGGYDSIENEFTFSYYLNGNEYYFQLSLNDIIDIANNKIFEIELIPA